MGSLWIAQSEQKAPLLFFKIFVTSFRTQALESAPAASTPCYQLFFSAQSTSSTEFNDIASLRVFLGRRVAKVAKSRIRCIGFAMRNHCHSHRAFATSPHEVRGTTNAVFWCACSPRRGGVNVTFGRCRISPPPGRGRSRRLTERLSQFPQL